jgi:hypothetical protein
MGKRELVLIALFAVIGVVVYQVTAPPPQPGSQGFSLSRIIQSMRRGVHGNRASAQIDRTRTEPVDAELQDLRFALAGTELTVTGEDRSDISIQMHVTSSGFDDAEAKRLAEASALSVTRAGPALVFAINFPREARQSAVLTLKVPKRLRMRLEPMGGGKLDASNLAGVEVMGMGGDLAVRNIAGPVIVNQRRGSMTIDSVGSLKLSSRGEAKVQHVLGTLTVQANGGELTLEDIVGPAEIETHNTDVRLENVKQLKAPLRIDASNGTLKVSGLRTDARIDGRETDLDISFDGAVPATIYSTGADIVVTPPPGGYTLDAVATDGRITIDDDVLKPTGSENEQRAIGPVKGGGPTLTLRATRAEINVRSRPKQ